MLNNNMLISVCEHCKKEYELKPNTRGRFCSLSCGNYSRGAIDARKRLEKYTLNPKFCVNCSNTISYESRKNKYCSHKCSAIDSNKKRIRKLKIKTTEKLYCKVDFKFCKIMNKWYCNKNSDGTVRRSSPYVKTEKQKYYMKSRFKFNVYDYQNEFNISLIENIGWYTCPSKKRKNKIKNINGASRDHIISVSYGFANKIDPKIISHPANCQIVIHKDNKLKSSKCGMMVDELLEKIKLWDEKYGAL